MGTRGRSFEVEIEEAGEEVVVGYVGGPAVGGEDGVVEGPVGVAEPGRHPVVELGEGALLELLGRGAGGVQPAFAQLVEALGGGGDGVALLVGGCGKGNVSKVVVGV